jgi:hypothetical protein
VLKKIDAATWVAVACIILGWFGLNTLVATFGPIEHAAYFYDLGALMREPRWLLTGVSVSRSFGTIVFGLICLIVAAVPLLPRLGYPKVPWLLSSLPLLFMLLCGITLYVKASYAHIEATDSLGRLGGYIARWANAATDWTGDVISRHIAMGAGSYLSFVAGGWLAFRGVVLFASGVSRNNGSVDNHNP